MGLGCGCDVWLLFCCVGGGYVVGVYLRGFVVVVVKCVGLVG